jgi:hypothetical protein
VSAGTWVSDVDLNLPGSGAAVVSTGRVSVSPDVWYARLSGRLGYGTTQSAAIVDVLRVREALVFQT